MASARPYEPPRLTGLPVTTPGTVWPACMEYVSIIQAMTWALVFMSGAGMSRSGPMISSISVVNRRVSASSSRRDSLLGSTTTPPLPPPYGMPTTAHFQVIHMARAFTSSSVTPWWYRMPPLAGPRPTLCWTR